MDLYDAPMCIRDWTAFSGADAWKHFAALANDAHRCAAYDAMYPEKRTEGGTIIGGPRLAARGRKAERQYRLAAWVLRRVAEGRDARDAELRVAAEEAELARILAKS